MTDDAKTTGSSAKTQPAASGKPGSPPSGASDQRGAAAPRPPAAGKDKTGGAAKSKGGDEVGRRGFLLGVAWGVFTAAMAACGVAMGRFMFPNVLVEPPSVFKIGSPDDYAAGEVDERWKDKFSIWVVRDASGLYVLSTVCMHLGCTPNWLSTDDKFKCPCHGSGFYRTGINFEGPAPRPLERFGVSIAPDGQIVVNKNRKLQQEKGQWEEPDAYLELA